MGVQVLAAGSAPSFWSGNAALISTDADVIRVNADAAATLRTDVGAIGPAGEAGVKAGGDTSMYREAADRWRTDDTFSVGGARLSNPSSTVLDLAGFFQSSGWIISRASQAEQVALSIVGGGVGTGIDFGIAGDTDIRRFAANALATDDLFYVSVGAQQLQMGAVTGGAGIFFGNAFDSVVQRETATGDLLLQAGSGIVKTPGALKLTAAGSRLTFGDAGQEQTTVGAAGAAALLPISPTKYIKIIDSAGTTLVIPAFAAA